MLRRGLTNMLTLLLAGALAIGCGDSSDDPGTTGGDGTASINGRIDNDGGNQWVGPSGAANKPTGDITSSATLVSATAIGDDGSLSVVGTGTLRADGSFTIDNLKAIEGPFLIQAWTEADGNVVAEALVLGDLGDGATMTSQPISTESSVEAEAFVALIASGHSADDIDAVGLSTRVSGELAASVDSGADLAAELWAAQEAELKVISDLTASTMTAAEMQSAKAEAFAQLTTKLHAATTGEAEARAWMEFMASVHTMADSVDSSSEHAAASLAASVALNAGIKNSTSSSSAMEAGTALSLWLNAHTSLHTMGKAADELDTTGSLRASVESSFETFFEAMLSAKSEAELKAAFETLNTETTGDSETTSALETAIDLEAKGSAEVVTAMNAFVESSTQASADLQTELEAATDTDAIATAFVNFETTMENARTQAKTAAVSDASLVFADSATKANSGSSMVLDIDIDVIIETTINIVGVLDSVGFDQAGAAKLVTELRGNLAAMVETVNLVELMDDGTWTTVGTGSIDAAGSFAFEAVNTDLDDGDDQFLVTMLDAEGHVVAATWLDGLSSDSGNLDLGHTTAESSAEVLVLANLMAKGHSVDANLQAMVSTMIDDAMAWSAMNEDTIDAMAEGIIAAEATWDAASTDGYDEHHASLMANAAFEATVSAIAGDESMTAKTTDARTQIETALAVVASLEGDFAAAGNSDASTELDAAVDAMIMATADAESYSEIAQAGTDAELAIVGDGTIGAGDEGVLESHLDGILGLEVLLQATLETFWTETTSLSAQLRSEITAAATANVNSDGMVDAGSMGSAMVDAYAGFFAGTDLVVESTDTGTMTDATLDLMVDATAEVNAALFGQAL